MGVFAEMKAPTDPVITGWDGNEMLASPGHQCAQGQYSDDGQMTLALARVIRELGEYDQEAAASAYLAWYQSGTARGMGGSIRKACEALAQGFHPRKSGVPGSQGNGTAMRAIPLGLLTSDRRTIWRVAEQDAWITHQSLEAVAGSYLVAAAASLARKDTWCRGALMYLRGIVHRAQVTAFDDALGLVVNMTEIPENSRPGKTSALAALLQLIPQCPGGVVETVATALLATLLTDSYEDCIEVCIRTGGDTDTRACIAGGIMGINHDVPARWVSQIEGFEEILALDAWFKNLR